MPQDVVIRFVADTSQLAPAVDGLAQIGVVDKKVAESFAASNKLIQQRVSDLNNNKGANDKVKSSVDALASSLKNVTQTVTVGNLKQEFDKFDKSIGSAIKTSTSLKQQLREITKEMAALKLAGKDTTDEYTRLRLEAGKIKDAIGDANKEISNTASDTKVFDGLIGAVRGVAAGFAIAQGAAGLFGKENEDVQKALLKVQSAVAILTGLQEIQNLVQKESAIRILAVGTATKVVSAIQKVFAVESAAAWAIATAGVSLLITGIVLLASNFKNLVEAITGVSEAQRILNDIRDASIEQYVKESESIQQLYSNATNLNASYQSRIDSIVALKKEYPELLANMNSENANNKEFADIINNKIIPAIKARTLAQSASKINEENTTAFLKSYNQLNAAQQEYVDKVLAGEKNISTAYKSTNGEFVDGNYVGIQSTLKLGEAANKTFNIFQQLTTKAQILNAEITKPATNNNIDIAEQEAALAVAKKGSQDLLNIQLNLITDKEENDKAAAKRNIADIDAQNAEVLKITNQANEQRQKLQFDFYSKQEKAAIDFRQSLLNIEKGKGEISEADYNHDSFNLKKKEYEDKIALARKYNQDYTGLQAELNNLIGSREEQERQEERKAEQVNVTKQELDLKDWYNKQLALLENVNGKTKLEIAKNNIDKLNLERNYQEQLFALQLKAAQDKLKLLPKFKGNDSTGEETTEYKELLNVIQELTNNHNATQNANQQKANEDFNQLTEEEFQESLRLHQQYYDDLKDKATKEFVKSRQSPADLRKYNNTISQINADSLKSQLHDYQDYSKDTTDISTQITNQQIKEAERLAEQKKQIEQQTWSTIKEIQTQAFDFLKQMVQASADAQIQIVNDAEEEKEKELQHRLDSKLISQKQYDTQLKQAQEKQQKDIKKIQHDAAVKEKQFAEFQIIINTAEAVIKTATSIPFPASVPLMAAMATLGAIQLAAVASKPIPLAKGTESVTGGERGKDSVHALLMPGERVVPTHINSKLNGISNMELPILAAIKEQMSYTMDYSTRDGVHYEPANSSIDYEKLGNVISAKLKQQLSKIPIHNWSIDKDGFNLSVKQGQDITRHIANRYNVGQSE